MPSAVHRPRLLFATLGFMLGTVSGASAQGFGFQASGGTGSAGGAPLNLLSPSFIAPAPRTAVPRGPATGDHAVPAPQQTTSAPAIGMAAPLPLPRPPEAPPRAVITAASAPGPVAAGVLPFAATPARPSPEAPLVRPSMEGWPEEEDRSRVILPGAYTRSAPASAAEAIAAAAPAQQAAPELPAPAVAFAAPVPPARPGAITAVASSGPGAAAVAAPTSNAASLASTSSMPVSLSSRGTATTTAVPAPPPGALSGAQPTVVTRPTPASGPVLAALPPDGGARDWPRYVPGARGTDRNLGIAGERVISDPGVPLSCLPAPVKRALNEVALRFGPVLVRSTHRGSRMFVRTDAWRGSYHRDCRAADFRVSGNPSAVLAFLRARHDLGGIKRYRNGLFHIDNGPRRSW